MGTVKVEVVCRKKDPCLQEVERRIKEWSASQSVPAANPARMEVERQTTLDSAVEKAREVVSADPWSSVLIVPLGFDDAELDPCDELDEDARIEVMCFRRAFDALPPSASLLEHPHNIAQDSTLVNTLEKSILRLHFRQQGIVIREIRDRELDQYFRLRYEIYRPLGYIPPELDAADACWELHWSDRWSLPLGVFTRSGELVGCARLVSEYGLLNNYSDVIERMVGEKRDPVLGRCWRLPPQPTYPFDLLTPFDGFQRFYRNLVRQQVCKAEVSRVMRLPQWRGQRLGEVIVDSLVSEAARRQIHLLFLACREEHQGFYACSGFTTIPGMRCDRFGTFPVPAVAMQRWLADPPADW